MQQQEPGKRQHSPYFRQHLEDAGILQPRPPQRRGAGKQPQRHHDERTNVLWLMADQYRGDMLAHLGHPAVRTPHLDRLAARGVSFTRSYCPSPVCGPSRASLLTGHHPCEHGVINNGHRMHETERCLPEELSAAGWRTANIGKTHCGRPTTRLFDFNQSVPDSFGTTAPSDVGFDPDNFQECVFIADEVCHNSDRVLYGTYPARAGITKSYRLASQAESFLYWHDEPKPFFLRVSFDDPHPPVMPPPEFAALYGPQDVPADLLAALRAGLSADVSPTVRANWQHLGHDRISEEQHLLHAARYMALCTHLDAQIGRVLDALEANGYAENTLVLFNSDHGHLIGEHRCTHKHVYLWEGVNRIPTIISWPGHLPAGRLCHGLVHGTDLPATIYDALGVDGPCGHGRSMLPLARGECERLHEHIVVQYDDFCFAIYDQRYKYITYDSDAACELYDLEADPWELYNLAGDDAHASCRDALAAALVTWRARHGAASALIGSAALR